MKEEREAGVLIRQMCSSPTDVSGVHTLAFRILKIINVEIKNYKKNTLKKKLKKMKKKNLKKRSRNQKRKSLLGYTVKRI
jgi:hypothetical protein